MYKTPTCFDTGLPSLGSLEFRAKKYKPNTLINFTYFVKPYRYAGLLEFIICDLIVVNSFCLLSVY